MSHITGVSFYDVQTTKYGQAILPARMRGHLSMPKKYIRAWRIRPEVATLQLKRDFCFSHSPPNRVVGETNKSGIFSGSGRFWRRLREAVGGSAQVVVAPEAPLFFLVLPAAVITL